MGKGFTLIEMLVVIAILGLLATVLLVTINPVAQIQKANDARRKGDLNQLQHALEMYYQDNGSYPPSSGNKIKGLNWGSSWSPYMSNLPQDPVSKYSYVYYSTGQAYYLYAHLERGAADPQACKTTPPGGACPSVASNGISINACGGVCDYGVSSPNVSP